jgi:hypothetical protein
MAEERVWMASYNLEDVAQLWYIQLQEDEGTPPWGCFKELLNLRFRPPLRSVPLFELAECRHTGTVEDYSNRYLWGRPFIVRTDHYSLKFLLDHRLATIPRHHWVGKLKGKCALGPFLYCFGD